ncbi:response regulator [Pseudomaricurvus alkylphenolicus]|jgi:CheY-like chemotaxis protein/outer membrane protein assembly factor BamD (BamD/ComL family)|uniref:response regulator n=1 Tax=Pseudomaricurvus alkylphenolicus TaxID=1306991 RepID=UPI00141EFFC3|nr:response regulator [Pseudomaricurvus alkylphenolicus]NIB44547.1 response regulator [Pseudomaricurvus alkylphenolicus]
MAFTGYGSLKVLVIDDFDSFRATVGRMLDDFGCRDVKSVTSGNKALEACNRTRFDLILCDYNLGDGPNGQQVLEQLRANGQLTRQSLFLMITAESSKQIVLSAYDYAPDAYLTKPITSQTLRQRLDRLLAQRQQMLPFYHHLENFNLREAVDIAVDAVAAGSRYATIYQRQLADVYLQQGMLDEAEDLYTRALEVRPLDWAKVGMSRVKRLRGDLEMSNQWLHQIVESNPFCMQAYDVMVENYQDLGLPEKAQEVLQTAVDISPMSILRQTNLGQIADTNNDIEVATRAFGNCVKLGEYSCHDRLENHMQFGRSAAAWVREAEPPPLEIAREGLQVIEKVPRRFELLGESRLQAQLLESQLNAGLEDTAKAWEKLQEAEEKMLGQSLSLDVQLDRVSTYLALGRKDRANDLLNELIEQYHDDQDALQRIDRWLEEPVSERNRRLVAKINNEGIHHYQERDYGKALDSFKRARRLFPNHLGVHLNLAQALIAEMKEFGRNEEHMELCLSSLQKVAVAVEPGHTQFERYRQLQQMAKGL